MRNKKTFYIFLTALAVYCCGLMAAAAPLPHYRVKPSAVYVAGGYDYRAGAQWISRGGRGPLGMWRRCRPADMLPAGRIIVVY